MLSGLNEVCDHLYISSMRSVNDEALQEKGISCVINCSMCVPSFKTDAVKYYPITVC